MPQYPQNFLFIIGSPKAGTTSLANWLDQRDDMVLGTIKEPRYFTDFADQVWTGPGSGEFLSTLLADYAVYQNNFKGKLHKNSATTTGWAIDASTDYLWCEASAAKIKSFSKSRPCKIICILRDPVERALSEYNHTLRDRLETLSLFDALDQEETRLTDGWQPLFYHKRRSTCLEDLQRYAKLFGDDLLVLGFHEFKEPEKLLAKVHKFLDLPGQVVSPQKALNDSALPRNGILGKLYASKRLKSIGRMFTSSKTRATLRGATHISAKKLATTTTAETDRLRELLADEIDACIASPLVVTEHWKTAINA